MVIEKHNINERQLRRQQQKMNSNNNGNPTNQNMIRTDDMNDHRNRRDQPEGQEQIQV